MRNALKRRFWLETGLATITGMLFVITLVWRGWIEIVFGVDPDQGNGALEWLIVGALLVVTITLLILASYEWRRTRAAVS
jgi:tetrahydromethanopterin S-methyltransferase subunit E